MNSKFWSDILNLLSYIKFSYSVSIRFFPNWHQEPYLLYSALDSSCTGSSILDSSWNVMAHGDAREGKWRGNWRMQWVASTLHSTSEHGVSSITTAHAHTSVASSRLTWRPPADLNGLVRFARKTKSGFCACAITFQLASTNYYEAHYKHSYLPKLATLYATAARRLINFRSWFPHYELQHYSHLLYH